MTISPSWMLNIGINPPSGIRLSCMAFTAPQLAAVVTATNSAVAASPNRTSLPSILPPARLRA